MPDPKQHSLDLLMKVAGHLGELGAEMVYLGGATTCLLVSDLAASTIRFTNDVDVVVEIGTTVEYQTRLRRALIDRGFTEDTAEGAPTCRWVVDGVKVDVMPADPSVLGFANRWYPDVLTNFNVTSLPNGSSINLVSPPYFVGTKLEAFAGRGAGDFHASADLEDIITVVDGRAELVRELLLAPIELRSYVQASVTSLLNNPGFIDALPGHLAPDVGSQGRLMLVRSRLEMIAAGGPR